MENVSTNKRLTELDSLRGIAALTVFFSHAVGMTWINGPVGELFTNTVLHIFWDGTAAVVLFFVLSGFVLALPYVSEQEKKVDFIPFYIRRFFRIYPAYIAALAISMLLKTSMFDKSGLETLTEFATMFWNWRLEDIPLWEIIKHIIMVGPYFEMGMIDPVIWSLVVEMKMSILFPFLIPLIRKTKSLKAGALLLVASMLFYYITEKNIIAYIPFFVLGGLLARFRARLAGVFGRLPLWTAIVLGGLSTVLYTAHYSLSALPVEEMSKNYLISSGTAIIILLAVSRKGFSSILSLRPFKFLGDVSYSFYLLHFPVLLTITSILYKKSGSLLISYLASLISACVLSYLMYKIIECPFQSIGRKLSKIVIINLPLFKKEDQSEQIGS